MSNYKIAVYPQDKYRFELFDNVERLTWQEIKRRTGCCALVNLWYFALAAQPGAGVKYFDHQNGGVMLKGKWVYEKYDFPGICITADGRVSTGWKEDAGWDYAAAGQAAYLGGRLNNKTAYSRNGVTYTGIKGDGSVVCLLASKDAGLTGEEAVAAMLEAGCVDILRWDGSWSSQGSLGPGMDVQPSQRRICRGWLLVFPREDKKEEGKPMSKQYTVTPDIGVNIRKGPGTDYNKCGGYSKGTVITVTEEQDGWGKTSMGWVKLSNLSLVTSTDTSGTDTGRKTDNGISITEMLVSKGRKNRPGKSNPCKFITIHETGNFAKGADAKAHGSYVRGDSAQASRVSWHYTVDDHSIVQHIPDGETAYHAGDGASGPGNCTSIGIEICVNADGDFTKAQDNAAALVRLLLLEHGITIDNVVQHNRWNGKDCPYTIRHTAGAWAAFLADCEGQKQEPDPWYTPGQKYVMEAGISDGDRPLDNCTRAEVWEMLRRSRA